MYQSKEGFTLIELSIVLVIIGLIVGGVLVGRDLIRASEVRSQITQIEQINTAVNTFRGKFNALPGDMPVSVATQFGFSNAACAGTAGQRDGNLIIQGVHATYVSFQGGGETGLFWNDLTSSVAGGLFQGSFTTATCSGTPTVASTQLSLYIPRAKIGGDSYVYVDRFNGLNYIAISKAASAFSGQLLTVANIPVGLAYNIDTKTDDGLPTTGRTLAKYFYPDNAAPINAPTSSSASSTTCYDTTSGNYSISVNNGIGANCALIFQFQ